VVCSPSTRVTDRRWRTPSGVVRHRWGGEVGPESACSRAETDARECARASFELQKSYGRCLDERSVFGANPERAAGGVNGV
jgi:hypothetical protein